MEINTIYILTKILTFECFTDVRHCVKYSNLPFMSHLSFGIDMQFSFPPFSGRSTKIRLRGPRF